MWGASAEVVYGQKEMDSLAIDNAVRRWRSSVRRPPLAGAFATPGNPSWTLPGLPGMRDPDAPDDDGEQDEILAVAGPCAGEP